MVPAVAVATAVCGALAACGSATQEAAPDSASAGADPLSILFIDLDGFKAVNDSLGHVTGDQVLKEVAARLLDAVRPRDAVSRYGGVSVIDFEQERLIALDDQGASVTARCYASDGLVRVRGGSDG